MLYRVCGVLCVACGVWHASGCALCLVAECGVLNVGAEFGVLCGVLGAPSVLRVAC